MASRHNGNLAEWVSAGYDQMPRVMKIQDINVTVIYTGVSCQNGKQVELNVTITIILHLFIIKSEKSTMIQIHQLLLLQHRNM